MLNGGLDGVGGGRGSAMEIGGANSSNRSMISTPQIAGGNVSPLPSIPRI